MAKFRNGDVILSSGQSLVMGGKEITGISDDSDMTDDSEYLIPTQKAVKGYADVHGGGSGQSDRIVDGDTYVLAQDSTQASVNIESNQVLAFHVTENGVKLENGARVNEFSTDTALSGNSDSLVPTQKAVKGYVDTLLGDSGGSFLSGTGSPSQEIGEPADHYLDDTNNDLYKKDVPAYGLTSLFTGGTPSASAEGGGGAYPAREAVDGSTYYLDVWKSDAQGAPYGPPQWWKYDFGEGVSHAVCKLRVYNGSGESIGQYEIRASDDDSDWTTITSGTVSDMGWIDIEFINTTAYRYYQVYIITAAQNGIIGMREIEAYAVDSWDWRLVSNLTYGDATSINAVTRHTLDNTGTNIVYHTGPIDNELIYRNKELMLPSEYSVNGNQLTIAGLDGYDDNTLNPLNKMAGHVLSNGNLNITSSRSLGSRRPETTGMTVATADTGKFYFEVEWIAYAGGSGNETRIGWIDDIDFDFTQYSEFEIGYEDLTSSGINNLGFNAYNHTWYLNDSQVRDHSLSSETGDVMQFAFDIDSGKFWMGINDVWTASGNPSTGGNPNVTITQFIGKQLLVGICVNYNAITLGLRMKQEDWTLTCPTGFSEIPGQAYSLNALCTIMTVG
jgi:hypothetical protein